MKKAVKKLLFLVCMAFIPFVNAGNWSDVQASIDNSVVQVVSYVAYLNWLEPYKTPKQSMCAGSSFFIDDEGHLITNAHVVDQAVKVEIQLPYFGQERFGVDVVAICPEYDLALLQVCSEDWEYIKQEFGTIQHLELSDSDYLRRADDVLALGYPLGQESLKSTTGVISGRQHIDGRQLVQMSAPINPGSSGGPILDSQGKVVGVSCSGIAGAGTQNVGYFIPSNEVKLFLQHMQEDPDVINGVKIVRTSFWHGVLTNHGTEGLTRYLGNPLPGGLYIASVSPDADLYEVGVRDGDMLYEIDGHRIDSFGQLRVWWSEDRVSIVDYAKRCSFGDTIDFVVYRRGERLEMTYTVRPTKAALRLWCPWYENIDYEVIGGMVVMELTKNHLDILCKDMPRFAEYRTTRSEMKPVLFVSHLLSGSLIDRARTIDFYDVIDLVNGQSVSNLAEFRSACKKSVETGFLAIKVKDAIFDAFDIDEIIEQEPLSANCFFYQMTPFVRELIAERVAAKV